MFLDEHLYILALKQCQYIGNINLRKLLKHFGSAKTIWETPPKKLLAVDGIGKKTIQDIGKKELLQIAEKELDFCSKNKIQTVCINDDNYPRFLYNCDDAPAILFYKGNLNIHKKTISIVGTRNATVYGKNFIKDFLSNLDSKDIVTISGLAIGIDSCVHEESIKNNIPTIAVLAQSLDTIYPATNKKLAEKIVENNGALISEYARFDGISKEYFLQRNRIIAGFSQNLIVVETAFGGGSVTTVNYANQYNRDVFALPGKIDDKYSQGCNLLIYNNKAESIVDIKSLIKNLNYTTQEELFPIEKPKIKLPENKKEYQYVLNIITENKTISLDEIADKSKILHHKLLPILLDLEIYGYISSLSGRQYQIIT